MITRKVTIFRSLGIGLLLFQIQHFISVIYSFKGFFVIMFYLVLQNLSHNHNKTLICIKCKKLIQGFDKSILNNER